MADWYRDHDLSPEAYSETEYLGWAQDQGLYVDAAGNVDYGPPAPGDERYIILDDEDVIFVDDSEPNGLDTWDF